MNGPGDQGNTESTIDAALNEYFRLVDQGQESCEVIRARVIESFADASTALKHYFATEDRVLPQLESRDVDVPELESIRYFGNYEILEEVGRGGMGIVYKARQTTVDRIVAVKMILKGQLADETEIERFRHEAKMAAQLNHPNIVAIHEVGEHKGQHYFSMDFVEGDNLAKVLHDRPPTRQQAAEFANKIADAIDFAHQQGVLHRDLKPANIMLDTETHEVRITDFGLGKRIGEDLGLTETGLALGTLRYMAPEQADGNRALTGVASDVYSIGAILYELLTGCPAVWSGSLGGMLHQIQIQEPIAPRRHDKSIPADLATICLKCLEKAPHNRYATAGDLASDLARFLEGKPVYARPIRAPARAWRWSKRNPGWATSIVTAMLLVVATIFYFARTASMAELEQRRQTLLFDAERISEPSQRLAGWRDQLREDILASGPLRTDEEVVGAFTRTFSGVDAFVQHQWPFESGRVAFNQDDSRVIFSLPGGGAREIEVATGTERRLRGPETSRGMGPLGFNSQDQPCQVTCLSPDHFRITTLGDNPSSVELNLPDDLLSAQDRLRWLEASSERKEAIRDRLEEMAQATPNLSHIVTWSEIPNDVASDLPAGIVSLWNGKTGEQLVSIESEASALGVSPDGEYLAIGGADGTVRIHSHDSKEPWEVPTGLRGISAIDFGHHPPGKIDNGNEQRQGPNWLLAIANAGGTILVWDLAIDATVNKFSRIRHGVNAVRFRANSLVLISVGYNGIRLWDTFGGASFLKFHARYRRDIAMSSDGKTLAIPGIPTSIEQLPQPSCLWRIESDRGIRTLRGLSATGAKVVFSDDNRLIAAVAHDWTIAVWDVESSQLIQRLRPAPGLKVDNCALRFSADGSEFFFSAGPEMSQWDIATGRAIQRWPLPSKGLQDRIGITSDGRVLLMRYDREAHSVPATGDPHRGVCRLREMNDQGSDRLIAEWTVFDQKIISITGTRDGRYFVLDGKSTVPNARPERGILLVDTHAGETNPIPVTVFNESTSVVIADDAGFLMQFVQPIENNVVTYLYRLADRERFRSLPFLCSVLSPDGRMGWGDGSDRPWCYLFSIENVKRLVRLQLASIPSLYDPAFSLDGKYVAWANDDGSVSVCDIERVRRELRAVNASW